MKLKPYGKDSLPSDPLCAFYSYLSELIQSSDKDFDDVACETGISVSQLKRICGKTKDTLKSIDLLMLFKICKVLQLKMSESVKLFELAGISVTPFSYRGGLLLDFLSYQIKEVEPGFVSVSELARITKQLKKQIG